VRRGGNLPGQPIQHYATQPLTDWA
jgi:hypothetical protein